MCLGLCSYSSRPLCMATARQGWGPAAHWVAWQLQYHQAGQSNPGGTQTLVSFGPLAAGWVCHGGAPQVGRTGPGFAGVEVSRYHLHSTLMLCHELGLKSLNQRMFTQCLTWTHVLRSHQPWLFRALAILLSAHFPGQQVWSQLACDIPQWLG